MGLFDKIKNRVADAYSQQDRCLNPYPYQKSLDSFLGTFERMGRAFTYEKWYWDEEGLFTGGYGIVTGKKVEKRIRWDEIQDIVPMNVQSISAYGLNLAGTSKTIGDWVVVLKNGERVMIRYVLDPINMAEAFKKLYLKS
ncbi:hypothetical protein [Sulfolobus acidocaldarius]|uniref:Conserved conjugative plasmid protein n=4 Tax=Sulfolobus acidocaldarius TaxID=2285 RepID=Q4JBB1_SULAC|nr:hypothetical protein [Sulfolobus acidocaldarius]AAY79918.1 conserved conjugative plasmid protein [Sulfolobus acidocaldarius DSM 639]AGE70483.1 conjugative plasmid protein [Sulfolobus acidocaldarius N8]AGE72756.1 conjugative plasmid protein [Sulfolobus acidocaldarius Ron12/I]ALU29142.1 conjugal transfer protein [Sulfolobus acidocaldarius]ALU31868.1 conjugal transfer protein [Sulfolobus acidocaldarius]